MVNQRGAVHVITSSGRVYSCPLTAIRRLLVGWVSRGRFTPRCKALDLFGMLRFAD